MLLLRRCCLGVASTMLIDVLLLCCCVVALLVLGCCAFCCVVVDVCFLLMLGLLYVPLLFSAYWLALVLVVVFVGCFGFVFGLLLFVLLPC